MQNSQAVKRGYAYAFKNLGGKSCEIKFGSQEIAAMMLILQPLLNFVSVNITAAISWPPSLISQHFIQAFEVCTILQLGCFA